MSFPEIYPTQSLWGRCQVSSLSRDTHSHTPVLTPTGHSESPINLMHVFDPREETSVLLRVKMRTRHRKASKHNNPDSNQGSSANEYQPLHPCSDQFNSKILPLPFNVLFHCFLDGILNHFSSPLKAVSVLSLLPGSAVAAFIFLSSSLICTDLNQNTHLTASR